MSHTVKIQTMFKDLRCLTKAFEALGWKIKENSTLRNYGYDNKTYKYVAVNPDINGYDVGIEEANGELQVMTDFFGGSVAKTLGADLSILKQNYAIKVIEDDLEPKGYMINVTKLDNGYLSIEAEM